MSLLEINDYIYYIKDLRIITTNYSNEYVINYIIIYVIHGLLDLIKQLVNTKITNRYI